MLKPWISSVAGNRKNCKFRVFRLVMEVWILVHYAYCICMFTWKYTNHILWAWIATGWKGPRKRPLDENVEVRVRLGWQQWFRRLNVRLVTWPVWLVVEQQTVRWWGQRWVVMSPCFTTFELLNTFSDPWRCFHLVLMGLDAERNRRRPRF